MDVGHRISTKGAMSILCLVDGSNQADLAFKSCLNMRRKFDHITVFHAYREDDGELQPPTWRHNQLSSKYDIELIGHVPKSLHSLVWVDREGASVNTVLHRCVDPEFFTKVTKNPSPLAGPPDLIVMGHHGRKGPKDTKGALGTTADQALRMLHYPCIIIKTEIPVGPKKIIMAVNESGASKRGFDILLRFVNPRDQLTVIHLAHPVDLDPTRRHAQEMMNEYFEKELREVGPVNSKFETVEFRTGVPPSQAIADYV
eukprot:CAMPEP_0170431356 /NCGR_PEP_ID=MMETSP0117_2-20130122/41358_1 /TAXON_ID=400756 /ORGANISM="Durinskia baltica, Strain CSIRO CS-38" /LENGTH=256 /DNA_ID=CAMNT_0010690907 /DNA_START=1 /DNA_END=768 /DNA_ORIENTATION=+